MDLSPSMQTATISGMEIVDVAHVLESRTPADIAGYSAADGSTRINWDKFDECEGDSLGISIMSIRVAGARGHERRAFTTEVDITPDLYDGLGAIQEHAGQFINAKSLFRHPRSWLQAISTQRRIRAMRSQLSVALENEA